MFLWFVTMSCVDPWSRAARRGLCGVNELTLADYPARDGGGWPMPPSRGECAAARLGERPVGSEAGHACFSASFTTDAACSHKRAVAPPAGEQRVCEQDCSGRASRHGRVGGRRCWQQLQTIRRCWGSPPLPPSVPLSRRAADDRITVAGSAMPSSAHILKVLSIVDF